MDTSVYCVDIYRTPVVRKYIYYIYLIEVNIRETFNMAIQLKSERQVSYRGERKNGKDWKNTDTVPKKITISPRLSFLPLLHLYQARFHPLCLFHFIPIPAIDFLPVCEFMMTYRSVTKTRSVHNDEQRWLSSGHNYRAEKATVKTRMIEGTEARSSTDTKVNRIRTELWGSGRWPMPPRCVFTSLKLSLGL